MNWRWAIVVSLAAAFAFASLLLYQMVMQSHLMRAWSDDVASHPALLRYAARRARPVYIERCASCHGLDRKGSIRLGVPDLTDRDWLYGSGQVSEIEQTILWGIRSGHHKSRNFADMPAFMTREPYKRYAIDPLTPGEIHDVVQYIFAAQHRPADRTAAARGFALYLNKGQCADCHTTDLRGDNYIGAPSLLDDVGLYGDASESALFASIAYGRSGVCPAWSGRLAPADIRALAVYLHANVE